MRGQRSEVGDTRVSANGYMYIRTPSGWKLLHRVVLEDHLQRPIADNERVRFKDDNKLNCNIDNLVVYEVKASSNAKRRAIIQAKIDQLQAELDELED